MTTRPGLDDDASQTSTTPCPISTDSNGAISFGFGYNDSSGAISSDSSGALTFHSCCRHPHLMLSLQLGDKKEARAGEEAARKMATMEAAVKLKKAPAKALPEMMEEGIIPSLRAALEAQEEMSQIEISFQENRLEGSFLKKDKPYNFQAFFPNGVLTGPSTVEPFLIDEREITEKLVVFWIRKRLAALVILPVWHKE